MTDILVYTPRDKPLYPELQTYILGYSLPNVWVIFIADRYSLVYTLGDRPLYTRLLTDIQGSSVAYRSFYTLTDIPVYTPGDRPLYPSYRLIYWVTVYMTGIRILCRWPIFRYVLQVTGGYTRAQCSLQILLYFVADRYSGPGERLLFHKLQTDTLGYNVAERSLYTLTLTDIPVYTLGDRPLYPGLLTDIPVYSVTYRSWFTLSLTNILVYSLCDRPLYPRITDWYTG